LGKREILWRVARPNIKRKRGLDHGGNVFTALEGLRHRSGESDSRGPQGKRSGSALRFAGEKDLGISKKEKPISSGRKEHVRGP